jgi:hypothetical protein
MPLYEIASDRIHTIQGTTFSAEGLKERGDLQRLLRSQIEIVCPDTLVISEEFGDWDDSQRRIDLLGLDKDANLVVIELKRTDDGSHMELQALRYAAMISTMTFANAVEVYGNYLRMMAQPGDAQTALLDFLGWDEPDADHFAQDVHIVLVSADFSKEITTAVLWLNERDLDIRCIRLRPYKYNGRVLIDVEQVIPLPESAEYQIKVSTKARQERLVKSSAKDYVRYDVTAEGVTIANLPKRKAIFRIVQCLAAQGVSPDRIAEVIEKWMPPKRSFWWVEGSIDVAGFLTAAPHQAASVGRSWSPIRYFVGDDDLIHAQGRTFAFSNQWGTGTEEAMQSLVTAFPQAGISFSPSTLE